MGGAAFPAGRTVSAKPGGGRPRACHQLSREPVGPETRPPRSSLPLREETQVCTADTLNKHFQRPHSEPGPLRAAGDKTSKQTVELASAPATEGLVSPWGKGHENKDLCTHGMIRVQASRATRARGKIRVFRQNHWHSSD